MKKLKSSALTQTNGASKASIKKDSATPGKKHTPLKGSTGISKDATGLRELFEDSLKDIYWAEKALVKAIPKMVKNASSGELISGLEDHLAVTREQVVRLEQVFSLLNKTARARKCDAMEGLIKETESVMEETEEGVVRDAGIIMSGQKVEHYEIATYGTLCSFAKILGEEESAALLEESLNEEKDADRKLTELAETSVNIEAARGNHDDGIPMEAGISSGKRKKSV